MLSTIEHVGTDSLCFEFNSEHHPGPLCTLCLFLEKRLAKLEWHGFVPGRLSVEILGFVVEKLAAYEIELYLSDGTGLLGEPHANEQSILGSVNERPLNLKIRKLAYVRPLNFLTAIGQEKFVEALRQMGLNVLTFNSVEEAEQWLEA